MAKTKVDVHHVIERRGGYVATPFRNLTYARKYILKRVEKNPKLKFAIVRNRGWKLIETVNRPNWAELRTRKPYLK